LLHKGRFEGSQKRSLGAGKKGAPGERERGREEGGKEGGMQCYRNTEHCTVSMANQSVPAETETCPVPKVP
jgi:hypothetical protein